MNPYYLSGDGLGYAQPEYPHNGEGEYSDSSSSSSMSPGDARQLSRQGTNEHGHGQNLGHSHHPSAPAVPSSSAIMGPLVHPHQDLNDFLESFWTRQMDAVEGETPDFKTYNLPLARIKKVMKSDEEVKMISAEAPIMFSKACEVFISELTCRAWLVAESHKRRTLQKSDVAAAIAFSDMFDFLIDIVPRDDGESASVSGNAGGAPGSGGPSAPGGVSSGGPRESAGSGGGGGGGGSGSGSGHASGPGGGVGQATGGSGSGRPSIEGEEWGGEEYGDGSVEGYEGYGQEGPVSREGDLYTEYVEREAYE